MFVRTALRRALIATTFGIATLTAQQPQGGFADKWLAGMNGRYKQFFDAPAPAGGIPLVHIMNYYDTYNKAYNVKDADIDAVLTFYGSTTFHGLNDAMWSKYRLGEFLNEKDGGGKPLTANPWRAAPVVVGMSLPQASIESLQKRGATMLICNNALGIFSGLLAQQRGLDAKAVYDDMKANILPGVELIPGMVVAVEQAKKAGLSYHRQSTESEQPERPVSSSILSMTMLKALALMVGIAAPLSAQAAPRVATQLLPPEFADLEKVRKDVWVNWFAGDTAALHRILAPELVAISPDGRESLRQTLDGSAEFKKNGGKLISISFDSNVVHRFGDAVILFSRYTQVTAFGGKRGTRSGQVTEIFIRQNGRWVHTSWHLDGYGQP